MGLPDHVPFEPVTVCPCVVVPLTVGSDVTLRGATQNFDDVVLVGAGMSRASYGDVPNGIETIGDVQALTIANLSIRGVYGSAIAFGAGASSPHVDNVHLVDAGSRFILSAGGTGGAIVEGSILEYTDTARDNDARALDVYGGASWVVRNNLFRNIVGPSRQPAGPAIAMSRGSRNTTVERNSFVNVTTAVAFGISATLYPKKATVPSTFVGVSSFCSVQTPFERT